MGGREVGARVGDSDAEGQAAGAWSPEDFQRRVHVSWAANAPEARAVVPEAFDFEHVVAWGVFAAAAGVVAQLCARIPLAPVAGLAGGAVAAWFARWLQYRRLPTLPDDAARSVTWYPDSRFRIRLGADSRRAEALRHLGDESSEPLIFRVFFGIPAGPRGVRRIVPVLLAFGLMAVIWAVLDSVLMRISGLIGVAAGIATGAVLMFCWPIYFRVAPGRLDVFQYRFLGRGRPSVRTFDLRGSGVLVDADQKNVVIEPPEGPRDRIHYGGVSDNLGFARAVLEAARSQRTCPPLPDDALTG